MFPFTVVKVPTPLNVIQPQIIKLILALQPGLRHWGSHSSPGFRHTKTRLFSPTMSLHSSENVTRLQSLSTVQYLFPRAQARRPLTFASRILIFFHTTRQWKLFLYKQRLTVTLETTSSRFSLNFLIMSCNGNDLLFLSNLKSLRVSLSSSFFFLPLHGQFSMSPRSRYLFTTAYTVALFSWRFLPISEYDFPAS
jgi:hypothetical protein